MAAKTCGQCGSILQRGHFVGRGGEGRGRSALQINSFDVLIGSEVTFSDEICSTNLCA